MSKENERIRREARAACVPQWRIAAALGISEPTFTRWLRFPLPTEKEQRILSTIESLAQEVAQ